MVDAAICKGTPLPIHNEITAAFKSRFDLPCVPAVAVFTFSPIARLTFGILRTFEKDRMTADGPSALSLATAGLYAVVVLSCALSARAAALRRQPPSHALTWALVGLLFALLALLRVSALEEVWRDLLRTTLYLEGAYEERRSIQKPVVAAIVAATSGLTFLWAYRFARLVRGRRNIATSIAQSSAFVMIILLILRIISLHAVDALLYGPMKFNWIIDIGASFLAGASGFYYWRLVSAKS